MRQRLEFGLCRRGNGQVPAAAAPMTRPQPPASTTAMDPELSAILAEKAGTSLALQSAWQQVAQRLLSIDVAQPTHSTLLQAADSPQILLDLLAWVKPQPDQAPAHRQLERLMDAVAESDFNLNAWLHALCVHQAFAEEQTGLCRAFGDALGYVGCCAEAHRNTPGTLSLAQLVAEMQEVYGIA